LPAPPIEGLRDRNKALRRAAILDATRELLRAAPGQEPTRRAIAERAGVAPATVYNLVGDRAQIWQALADALLADLEQNLSARPASNPLTRVRQIVDMTVQMFIDDPAVSTRVLQRWEQSGLVLRRGPIGALAQALAEAQEQALLGGQIDARSLAWNIGTSCVGAVHQWAAGQLDAPQLRVRVRLAAELTMAAVAEEPVRARLTGGLRRRLRALDR